jgi:hypothetical protein
MPTRPTSGLEYAGKLPLPRRREPPPRQLPQPPSAASAAMDSKTTKETTSRVRTARSSSSRRPPRFSHLPRADCGALTTQDRPAGNRASCVSPSERARLRQAQARGHDRRRQGHAPAPGHGVEEGFRADASARRACATRTPRPRRVATQVGTSLRADASAPHAQRT